MGWVYFGIAELQVKEVLNDCYLGGRIEDLFICNLCSRPDIATSLKCRKTVFQHIPIKARGDVRSILSEKMKQELYFLAIVPPSKIESEITNFKNEMAKRFDSRKALNSPGHITIIPPFKHPENKENNLIKHLQETLKTYNHFSVFLKDFDVFKPRVIFVDVESSADWDGLYKLVSANVEKIVPGYSPDSRPFHPHATIASRDLRKSEFYKAWEEFKKRNYERFFSADHVCLLKHDGKRWEIKERIFFRK
jgi:2'-5' RNA ligase